MKILDHSILVLNVLFDFLEVLGDLTVIFLFNPVSGFLTSLGS